MRSRIQIIVIIATTLCLNLTVYAQNSKCSLHTLAGTYVMQERGSSLILDPSTQPMPAHFGGVMAAFANIAQVTFTPDGVGNGYFWIWDGAVSATLDPYPLRVTVSEMNDDCTGKFTYSVRLLGLPIDTVIEERFIVFENGREIRSVPTSIQNGIPSMTWIGTAHRISRGSAPVNSCGPQTSSGKYLMVCENIVRPNPTTALADTFLLRSEVSPAGDYTGTLYEKYGPKTIELPVAGNMLVNPDCSFAGTLVVPTKPGTILTRGVYFNEGKEYYAMGILNDSLTPEKQGLKYSFCHGTRMSE